MTAFSDLIARCVGQGSLYGEHTCYAVPVLPQGEAASLDWVRLRGEVTYKKNKKERKKKKRKETQNIGGKGTRKGFKGS